jgi:adenylate kinase
MQAKAVMEAGELVSDEIVSALIGERLDAIGDRGAIFDGYPRTRAQAEALDALLAERGRKLDYVIELEVDEEALVERITGRFSCARCGAPYHDKYKLPKVEGICDVCGSHEFKRRPDDNEETVRTRLAEYRAKTAPILPYYEDRGLVRRVDGMAPVDEVTASIDAILDESLEAAFSARGGANEIACRRCGADARVAGSRRGRQLRRAWFRAKHSAIVPLCARRRDAPLPRSTGGGRIVTPIRAALPISAWSFKPGACFCERLPNGGGVEHMRVVHVDPGKRLVLTGSLGPLLYEATTGVMDVQVSAVGTGSRVSINYKVAGFATGGAARLAPLVDRVIAGLVARYVISTTEPAATP